LDLADLAYVSEADWCRASNEHSDTGKNRKINGVSIEDSFAWS